MGVVDHLERVERIIDEHFDVAASEDISGGRERLILAAPFEPAFSSRRLQSYMNLFLRINMTSYYRAPCETTNSLRFGLVCVGDYDIDNHHLQAIWIHVFPHIAIARSAVRGELIPGRYGMYKGDMPALSERT